MLRPMGIPPFGGRLLPMRLMATQPTGTAKETTTQSACLVCGGNTHPISTTAMCARNSCLRRSISNASMSTWCVAQCAWAPISRLSLALIAPIPCYREHARRSRGSISADRRPATAAVLTGRPATSRRTRLLTIFSSSVPGHAWPPRNGGIDANVGGIAVFSDPPSQLCLGRQQYIVDQRRRRRARRARLVKSGNVRGDGRRGEVAGLDAIRPRYQWQRQAGRVGRAQSTARSDQGQTHRGNNYSVAVSPADGAVWGSVLGYPGGAVRVMPGDDPTHTALTEFYEVPAPGFGPRGGDVDTDGVFWISLASGHLGSFDRRKCRGPLNGPNALGKHCPEGWTLYQLPGPQFRTVSEPGSAEGSYYVWVDWFDTFGLGRNVPFAMGNLSDSIYALVDGRLITLRVPYPMGMFAKNVDGRIDDANAGWKGRALWTTTGTRTFYHNEGGKGSRPQAIKIQLRPDPLAR